MMKIRLYLSVLVLSAISTGLASQTTTNPRTRTKRGCERSQGKMLVSKIQKQLSDNEPNEQKEQEEQNIGVQRVQFPFFNPGTRCSVISLVERQHVYTPISKFPERETSDCTNPQLPGPLYADITNTPWLLRRAASVGRLELRDKIAPNASNGDDGCYPNPVPGGPKTLCDTYDDWGTAFVIAKHKGSTLIATSCHAVESLAKSDASGHWYLDPGRGRDLLVDFGYRTEYHNKAEEFKVERMVAYSETEGLDVVFLLVRPRSEAGTRNVPPPLPLSLKPVTDPNDPNGDNEHERFILVGYPDFLHSIDPYTDMGYDRVKDFGTAKAAVPGDVEAVDYCTGDFESIDHWAATTLGESGSVLLARDSNKHKVIGMHVCCSMYWPDEPGDPPYNSGDMLCGHTDRAEYNKAITIEAMREDPNLCPYIGCKTPAKRLAEPGASASHKQNRIENK